MPIIDILAYSFIQLFAAYTINIFTKFGFLRLFSKVFISNILDLNKRELYILFILVVFTIIFGIYSSLISDDSYYNICYLIYQV